MRADSELALDVLDYLVQHANKEYADQLGAILVPAARDGKSLRAPRP